MKKILFPILVLLLFVVGCQKEALAPLEFSDFSVFVSGQESETAFKVAIDDYLAFADLSQNAISNEWQIDNGCVFLNKEISSSDTDFTSFIISSGGQTSTDKAINVLFQEAGLKNIQIKNTFDREPASGPATATKQGSSWVIDTTYVVDVFANLVPTFKVFQGTNEVLSISATDLPDLNNSATWPVVEVEAGQSLTFVDLTTIGRPTGRTWNLEGATPATKKDSAATVAYFSLGTYLAGGITSQRASDRPSQEATKIIPIQINVVPSSEPFLYDGNLKESVAEVISFNVGGELEPFTGQEGAFTVMVTNELSGFSQNIPVASAKVSEDDATKIELQLSEPIYNSDIITVAYSGTGIKSVDFRTLTDFGPETVKMHFEANLFPDYFAGFETPHANWKKAFCVGFWAGNGNGNAANPIFARTEEKAASGVASIKLDLYNGIETKTLQGTDFKTLTLAAGQYLLNMKLFLEEGNTMKTVRTIVQTPATPVIWDIENLPRGEWVEISQIVNFEEALSGRYDFKIDATDDTDVMGPQVLYLDDWGFIPVETR